MRGEDDCWEWIGGKDAYGYGAVRIGNKSQKAHRIALVLSGVKEEVTMDCCHACNNPGCVNPKHLRFGTRKDNFKDKEVTGAGKGSRNNMAKLNEVSVDAIRKSYLDGKSQYEIAREFNVSQPTVSMIVTRKIWRRA